MVIFGVKDNFADTKAKFKDIILFSSDTSIYNIPNKYVNTSKSYHNTYYFTTYQQASLFEASLWDKYKNI